MKHTSIAVIEVRPTRLSELSLSLEANRDPIKVDIRRNALRKLHWVPR